VPNLKGWEWLIIVALVLLLFGAKRLPDAARGLGRSLRIFKAETKGLVEDSDSTKPVGAAGTAEAIPPAPQAPPVVETRPAEPSERSEG
jgi:sec-independent protein translocase protein TatA